jgi:3-deoxy-D-manno-octulosonic acid (KDO) 8-phosphate synthase
MNPKNIVKNCRPKAAPIDGPNQLQLEHLGKLLVKLKQIHEVVNQE